MTILLRLLDEVSYDGRPVAGARPGDLLAALAQQRSGVADRRLVDEVWGDEPPAVPGPSAPCVVRPRPTPPPSPDCGAWL